MVPLDAYDRQLIGLLRQDARQPTSKLARRLGLADATVRRRVERLLAEDVIRPMLAVSPTGAGLIHATIGLRLDLRVVDSVTERVARLPEVVFAVVCTGPIDLFMSVLVPSQEALLSFLRDKLMVIPGVLDCQTGVTLKAIKLSYDTPLLAEEETPERADR